MVVSNDVCNGCQNKFLQPHCKHFHKRFMPLVKKSSTAKKKHVNAHKNLMSA